VTSGFDDPTDSVDPTVFDPYNPFPGEESDLANAPDMLDLHVDPVFD
jgi:hypothetical protein